MDGPTPIPGPQLDEILRGPYERFIDQARREALFGEISRLGSQAWMTGTDRDLFAPIAQEAQIFAVNRGKIGA